MSMMRHLMWAVSLAGLWATWFVAPVQGDEPRLDRFDPEARQLLGDLAKAYRAFPAINVEGELTVVSTIEGQTRRDVFPLRVRYERPDKIILDNGPVRIISDGKTLHTVVEPFRQYSAAEAPKIVTFDTLRSFPGIKPLIGGINGFPMFLLLSLVTEADAVKTLTMGASGMKLEADRTLEGKRHRCLFVDWPRGAGYRLLIDPADQLVARIELVHAADILNDQAPPGQPPSRLEIHWVAKSIRIGAQARDAFAFQPPKGFNEVAQQLVLERPLAPGEIRVAPELEAAVMGAMKAGRAMVGKPSPDFNVMVVDEPGKTKTIRKKDLTGRVVVIVIWPAATAEAFPGEMTSLPTLAESYRKSGAKVVFLFLPQDNLPGDPATIREHVEKGIASKGLKLPVGDVGRVVLDPELTISKAFHATALPTTVVIDGGGVVREVHNGFMEDRQETYRRTIDDLLAEKTPVNPTP